MKAVPQAIVAIILILSGHVVAQPLYPYESEGGVEPANSIDRFVLAVQHERGIEPTFLCSDEVFVRRVYLDVIGTLPDAREVRAFLEDEDREKRAALIEALFEREEFADYWAMKWCDILRVKAEFPINLWPNAVQAYHRWIRDALRENMPYDQFARELLTSSGSNFRAPPTNFYRAVQGQEPSTIAQAVALTFMGTRLDTWPEDRRAGMEALFSRLAFKKTAEWKEEIVTLDPAATEPLEAMLPDGRVVQIAGGVDPRKVFADWLIAPDNVWFSRNIVNRVWAWLLGRGIIHEPDDIQFAGNRVSNPELLAYIEAELVKADYDLRHIYRLILNSRTYQQSSIPVSDDPDAEAMFAYYPVRQLDAEVLLDALNAICGDGEGYTSMIPEPYTYIPDDQRTIALADGSITSPFLELFGRPPRDTGVVSERTNNATDAQRLHLLNSTHIQKKIESSKRLRGLMGGARKNPRFTVSAIYLTVLSRYPTPDESLAVRDYLSNGEVTPKQAEDDLVWALINTKEFLYRH